MTPRKRPSMQEARRRRQQEAFTGREDQLAIFREQLTLDGDDPRRRYVLNIHGQGGVGKTTLLREFSRAAAGAGALAVLTNDNEKDVPAAMARIVAELEQVAGADAILAFSTFTERHKTYLKKRGELESDPDAPSGLAGLFGRVLVRGSAKAIRNTVPGSDFALGLIEEPLADQAGQWVEFARRKLGNRDEVQLVLEPAGVLTPLFVAGLNALAEARRLVLLFDTYEYTAAFLDSWLRDLIDGRHGELPADLTFIVAGRDELSRDAWADFEPDVARLPLDPFTEDEARDYLARKGVNHPRVVAVILSLSGRLPLLLATLAAESPADPDQVGDASGTAVERFLKWVDDPARRALALDAALPRRLNRDVVGLLGGDAAAFDWLITNPFVQRLPGDGGWAYHPVVREQMLRHKRIESPAGWATLHERLAEYYRAARDDQEMGWPGAATDPDWRAAALEYRYHRLCARPQRELSAALNGFVVWLKVGWGLAIKWAEMILTAGQDAGHEPVMDWGESLSSGLNAAKESQYETTAGALSQLADSSLLEPANQAIIYVFRGRIKQLLKRYEEALVDWERAIELDTDNTEAVIERGHLYQEMERNEEALADFSRAIERGPSDAQLITMRGRLYQEMGRNEEALVDFSRAIERGPSDAQLITTRGRLYQELGQYEEALADFSRAIERDANDTQLITTRGRLYQKMGRNEEALADFNRAIELDTSDPWLITTRGLLYQELGQYEEALADFSRAIEIDTDDNWDINTQGHLNEEMKRIEEELANFNRAIKLAGTDTWAIVDQGRFLQEIGYYKEKLADFRRGINLNYNKAWAIVFRGLTYQEMGEYEKGLADFDRAVDLKPDDASTIASRGEIYMLMGEYTKAVEELSKSITLDPEATVPYYLRSLTRRAIDPQSLWREDLDHAVDLVQKALQRKPDHLGNLFNLAIGRMVQADGAAAEVLYRKALAATRGAESERANLQARPYAGSGAYHLRRAIRGLDVYLRLFPDDELAERMLSLLADGSSG